MSLAQHNRVYILHRSELPRCLPLLSQRVDVHPHISYHPQTAIYRIDGDDDQIVLSLQQNSDQPRHYHLQTYIGDRQARVTALSHRSSSTPSEHHTANTKSSPHLLTSTPQIWNLQIDALLFAIGREPCLDFLDISEHTQLASLLATGRLHIIGDVQRGYFRQVAIATGDGTYAAMQIQHTLQDPAGFGTHQL
jgi:thioredoxin reductase